MFSLNIELHLENNLLVNYQDWYFETIFTKRDLILIYSYLEIINYFMVLKYLSDFSSP